MKLLDVNEYAVTKLANRIMLLKHLVLETRDVKSCQIRHPEVRIRYLDTSEGLHRIMGAGHLPPSDICPPVKNGI